jgi:relaxase-like protein
MISKGTTHNNGVRLAGYMTTGKEGERAELWELRGFEATNIKDAFRDVQIMAGATKAEQPFFHVQVRNREGETLTRPQWENAADRIEQILGLTGQPRAIAFHTYEHNGEEHMHVAWSRIDQDTLTAKPLPFFKDRLKKISRELESHFALEPVANHREGHIKYAPTKAQEEQARRLGVEIHEVRNTIRDCWDRSDNGRSFQAALEHEGLTLAQGDRRNFVVIDHAGGIQALGKRILDVTAAQTRDRLSDLVREELPTVEDARAFIRDLMAEKERQHERAAPAWDRDLADRVWQDAVINAAIEKEKRQGEAGNRDKGNPIPSLNSEGTIPVDHEAEKAMSAYGYDPENSTTRAKWHELQIKVLAERISEKDRFREMDKHVWDQADRERRISAKEDRQSRNTDLERDR